MRVEMLMAVPAWRHVWIGIVPVLGCWTVVLPLAGQQLDPSPEKVAESERLFVQKVWPLLQAKCVGCHGSDPRNVAGELDLRTAESLRRGGQSGEAVVVPGRPETSPLYLAVTRTDDRWSAMPPKESEQLTEQERQWIRQWILAGAPWPKRPAGSNRTSDTWDSHDGVQVATSGGLTPEWTYRRYRPELLWAYQPLRRPEVPGTADNAIDAFLQQRWPAGLVPAPRADRRTLIRRATFDLTGLPPTPEEVQAFLDDPRSDKEAFAALVDRLLASPHYGERMAQHWLDVVRYADSSGFSNDYQRGNAWRYRDYVVRSFNEDKPYDRFIIEQIAGDELEPDNPEMLVAVGFLRMGPWELTAMEVPKIARQRFLDDVTNAVGETFLGQSLQCARCHDHKFDPIPTRDYYAITAVFATTQLAERPAPFLPWENTSHFQERRYLEQRRQDYIATLRELDDVLLQNAQQWFREKGISSERWNAAVEQARRQAAASDREFEGVFNAARRLLMRQGIPEDQFPPKLVGFTPEQFGWERIARKGLERLRWEEERYEPIALSVYDGPTPDLKSVNRPQRPPEKTPAPAATEATYILLRGDPFSPGDPVKPGVLSLLGWMQPEPIPESLQGRRLALARWIADPRNPLTWRTIVNRVWMWHFDRAIAGNPNNLGATGKPPTHPELLDWLAVELLENGRSLKSLHRLIMTSEAYCRSSQYSPQGGQEERELLETHYALFPLRRLSAEELRDTMLAVSGELNYEIGGIPNRPEVHIEVALQPRQVMGTFAAAWVPNALPQQRHRRSLYALKLRGLPDPMLETFNKPPADFSCERREQSTVAPQALTLLNSRLVRSRALAFAHRVLHEAPTDEQAIQRCFQLAFQRPASRDELQWSRAFWKQVEPMVAEPPDRTHYPCQVEREAVEENTGERFRFVERLYEYEDFVPDLEPADVSARCRALAELCLVLFNTNEFVYVP
ncbi:MAG: hypothetical protein KatS3mg110_0147 [Pirellulaceae bacterium]|nr:MAG: hypothetical protein KatS3mg110_0147 [Pirellulaceae bacterium]